MRREATAFIVGAAVGGAVALLVARARAGSQLGTASDTMAAHVRHIRRYAFASSQDKSPIVGLTHASYALVLLDVAEEAVGRDVIRAAGYDPVALRKFITGLQDKHAEQLNRCDPHLQAVLAIERGEGSKTPGFVVA